MKILLVEDDQGFAELVYKTLSERNYSVDLATDGENGLQLAELFEYDLILLDLLIPEINGIEFCQERRKQGDRTPIFLMTSEESTTSKVQALDAGADDYLIKPFDIEELLARIRALLRRGNVALLPVIEWGPLRLEPNRCQVSYKGEILRLTAKEYALIELFLRHPNRIFSQTGLIDHLWSIDENPSENAVRSHIKSLRQKLKQAGETKDFIETIYGLGYRLKQNPKQQLVKSQIAAQQNLDQNLENLETINPLPGKLTAIWQKQQAQYLTRIEVIEAALAGLKNHKCSPKLRQKAHREAHTLTGSLGIFGLNRASEQCRAIEQMLVPGKRFSKKKIEALSLLIKTVRQTVEQEKGQATTDNESNNYPNWKLAQSAQSSLPQLLIVDDDLSLSQVLAKEARVWKMYPQTAENLSLARKILAAQRPDLILLDLSFPDSTEDGLQFLKELSILQPPIPVLVFTARQDFTDRVQVARLGGRGFLQKPISPVQVMEAITQVLQQSNPTGAKILIVDDDLLILDFVQQLLQPWGFQLTLLSKPEEFWPILEQCNPDLLILDIQMPEFSGLDLCQVVRNDPQWQDLPILFLSAQTDEGTVQKVFNVGADDYIPKPFVGPELIARVLNRLKRSQMRRQVAYTDHRI